MNILKAAASILGYPNSDCLQKISDGAEDAHIGINLMIRFNNVDDNDIDKIRHNLDINIREAIGNGILTGPGHNIEVDQYNFEVVAFTDAERKKQREFQVFPDPDQPNMYYFVGSDGEGSDISFPSKDEAWQYILKNNN